MEPTRKGFGVPQELDYVRSTRFKRNVHERFRKFTMDLYITLKDRRSPQGIKEAMLYSTEAATRGDPLAQDVVGI